MALLLISDYISIGEELPKIMTVDVHFQFKRENDNDDNDYEVLVNICVFKKQTLKSH